MEPKQTMSEPLRDALDHIMRVARQGVTPTRRLDWIALRAKYALEGKEWSGDVRDDPRDSVAKLRKDLAASQAKVERLTTLAKLVIDWYENSGDPDPDQSSSSSVNLWHSAKAALAENPHE